VPRRKECPRNGKHSRLASCHVIWKKDDKVRTDGLHIKLQKTVKSYWSSPLNGANGSVDLDLAGGVVKQQDTAHDVVATNSGQLRGAGDPVRVACVLVDGQAVGQDARDSVIDPELAVSRDFVLSGRVVVQELGQAGGGGRAWDVDVSGWQTKPRKVRKKLSWIMRYVLRYDTSVQLRTSGVTGSYRNSWTSRHSCHRSSLLAWTAARTRPWTWQCQRRCR
jgi:hypothetical protein